MSNYKFNIGDRVNVVDNSWEPVLVKVYGSVSHRRKVKRVTMTDMNAEFIEYTLNGTDGAIYDERDLIFAGAKHE